MPPIIFVKITFYGGRYFEEIRGACAGSDNIKQKTIHFHAGPLTHETSE